MTQTLKNLLVLIIVIVFLALSYYLYTQRDAVTLSLQGHDVVSPVLLQETQVFISRRAELESRTLDTSLFTDPAFTSLRSYTTDIPDQSVGRSNIFDEPVPVPVVAPVTN